MPPENYSVNGRAAKVAGASVTGALLVWVVSQLAANEAAHAKAHQELAVAIARIEARLDYRLGKTTAPERAVAEAAEATALVEAMK